MIRRTLKCWGIDELNEVTQRDPNNTEHEEDTDNIEEVLDDLEKEEGDGEGDGTSKKCEDAGCVL